MNIDFHKATLITILREIYSDAVLRNSLGFKGGTAAMLFYKLPRFSVDLDFDLLDAKKKQAVFERLKELLTSFGTLREATEKRDTLFFFLSYQRDERNIKIELSKRPTLAHYVPKSYLGISVLVMKEEDMAAYKLCTVLTRKKFASRDLFDLWYFLKNNWHITEEIVNKRIGLSLSDAIGKMENQVKTVKNTDLLAGLGDLLDNKQKSWVREKLKEELLFQLKLYSKNSGLHLTF
ncbi:hypothetical protein A3D77_05865 [Candidatus Gottesmanbacteria bacterium RIFCSPHIGHO2_02_FULL_39_11]|uniref:Nucleotidyl transferase AbiEii/AbiGii toxin family protein n=1 Tax=Candidatus Gottesmanbacteria bacterium RIFCSPHIGHO2_02_FULL_39_11 TaxID=1798382 RepID=A0A1F5ZT03_9BACT|nr:MAG: hypothetical protein A3D77_05865 [Candidatus Gottesmanbacteria bacterium RIFCSPHIGHO2_02_FULL_39_11]